MKKIIRNICGLMCAGAVMAGFSACSSDDGPDGGGSGQQPPREFPESVKIAKFSTDLLGGVWKGEDKNVIVSPLSVRLAFAMLANGADGNTLREITGAICGSRVTLDVMNTLCADQLKWLYKDPAVNVLSVNSIWVDSTFPVYDDFTNKNRDILSAQVKTVDDITSDDSREKINRWVEEATDGDIKDLLSGNVEGRGAVLVNAIRLAGFWQEEFDEKKTVDGIFTTSTGKKVASRVMRNELSCPYADHGSYRVVRLPVGGGIFDFEIVLPAEGETPASIIPAYAANSQKAEQYLVDISLPKFSVEYDCGSLKNVLKSLGIVDAFDPRRSDFSKMTSERLFVSDVVQKSKISVDEQGVKASSGTGLIYTSSAEGNIGCVEFVVDRPFLFFLKSCYGYHLFAGVVNTL